MENESEEVWRCKLERRSLKVQIRKKKFEGENENEEDNL